MRNTLRKVAGCGKYGRYQGDLDGFNLCVDHVRLACLAMFAGHIIMKITSATSWASGRLPLGGPFLTSAPMPMCRNISQAYLWRRPRQAQQCLL